MRARGAQRLAHNHVNSRGEERGPFQGRPPVTNGRCGELNPRASASPPGACVSQGARFVLGNKDHGVMPSGILLGGVC